VYYVGACTLEQVFLLVLPHFMVVLRATDRTFLVANLVKCFPVPCALYIILQERTFLGASLKRAEQALAVHTEKLTHELGACTQDITALFARVGEVGQRGSIRGEAGPSKDIMDRGHERQD